MEQSTNLIPNRLTKPKQIINYTEAKPNTAENNPNLSVPITSIGVYVPIVLALENPCSRVP